MKKPDSINTAAFDHEQARFDAQKRNTDTATIQILQETPPSPQCRASIDHESAFINAQTQQHAQQFGADETVPFI